MRANRDITRLLAVIGVFAVACEGRPPPAARPHRSVGLAAPAPIDPSARGAAYLASVALQLQPPWGQFLDDCRLRLSPGHPLNVMARAATATLVIDRSGRVTIAEIVGSGDADFDRAVRGVIEDVTLAAPPIDLLADDDQLRVQWLFARDRRQAGPATSTIVDVTLPVVEVVERLLARGELARAVRRVIATDAADPARPVAAERVMVAVLREALDSANSPVRRTAIEAIGRAHVGELAADVRRWLTPTAPADLRLAAIEAVAAIRDAKAAPLLLAQLASDFEWPTLALADVAALVTLGRTDDAARVIATVLADPKPSRTIGALHAFARAPTPGLAASIAGWFERRDPRTRAAVCAALVGIPGGQAATLARGLRDADATVRAICIDAVGKRAHRGTLEPATIARLRELARDRDRIVRARAVAALVTVAPAQLPKVLDDDAPEVRAAYASARPSGADETLRVLAVDRDPDVRAAALEALGDRAPELVLDGASDAAPQVRRAAIAALTDDAALERLGHDASPEVATAASIRIAVRRGRMVMTRPLLERLIAAPPASAERVRAVLAWLLAS